MFFGEDYQQLVLISAGTQAGIAGRARKPTGWRVVLQPLPGPGPACGGVRYVNGANSLQHVMRQRPQRAALGCAVRCSTLRTA